MKGGNTEALYQGDGRLKMAQSLQQPNSIPCSSPTPHVLFAGQANPVLCQREVFVDAWQDFVGRYHEKFSHFHPKKNPQGARQFERFGASFGEAYGRFFAPLMPAGSTVRNLRDAYALIAYHTCQHPESHIAINFYLREILGHSSISAVTAQSYQKFYLPQFDQPMWRD